MSDLHFVWTQKSNWKLLLLLAFVSLQTGCHQSLAPGVLDNPDWSYSVNSIPPAQKVISLVPNSIASGDSLDTTTMHNLLLVKHPAVLSAEAVVKETRARNKVARRLPNPEFETRLMYIDGEQSKFEGALMFSLPVNGRLGAAGHVSDLELKLAEAALHQARKNAILELGSLLVGLEGARQRLALNLELTARSTEYAQLARTRLEASIADPLDVSLVLADAASDKRALTRSREEVVRLETEVRLLIGLKSQSYEILAPQLETEKFCTNRDSLMVKANQYSDSLLRARLEYQQAEWQSSLASRLRIPDIQLGPAFDISPDDTELGFAFGVPLPIFNSGTSEYKASLAHREAAYSALEYETRATNSNIIMSLNRLAALDQALCDLLGEVSTSAAEAFDLAQGRYLAGQTDVLHLLSAHRTYASVQLEIIDIKVARHEALLDLEAVIGYSLHNEHVPRQLEACP